jgi:acyl-CoA synthetase (AMP-forming)/AMP-acid ligase II
MILHTVPDILRASSCRFPDKTALIWRDEHYTYEQLDEASDRRAVALHECGVRPGDRVAVAAGNSAELILHLFAVWKVGGVLVDLNPTQPSEVLVSLLERTGAETLLVDAGNQWAVGSGQWAVSSAGKTFPGRRQQLTVLRRVPTAHCPLPTAHSLACISYTSGSTSHPRGVRLPHRNLIRNAELNIQYLDIRPDDRACLVLPLFFGMNRASLLAYFLAGATVLLERGFVDVNGVLDAMRRARIDSLSAVPSILHTTLTRGDASPERGPHLRSIRMGAGQVTESLLDGLSATFPGVRIFITYGLTEIGLVTVLSPEDVRSRLGSCGRLLPEVAVRLEEGTGEILVSGPHAAQGYEGDDEATRAVFGPEGIRTGDLGVLDADGFLYLKGRSKELIKSAGENISPAEIEAHLLSWSAVSECAVLGVPDEQLGETIRAYVVPAPGQPLDAAAVLQFCRKGLSPLKRPREVVLCATLPRTANGKVDRRALLADPDRWRA